MRVLFWNTYKNSGINRVLSDLIIENKIDIAILAEYEANLQELFESFSKYRMLMKQYITIGCERLILFGNITSVLPGIQAPHYSIQIINSRYILCSVHLTSQIYTDNERKRNLAIERIVGDIQRLEDELNIDKTIVVGDFNINPFDGGCVDANLFHSLPVYEDVKRKSRKIEGENYRMFYNPMWNFFGDHRKPYGTYYYNGSDVNNLFWNIYDQVIIRPSLRESFIDNELRIITETETKNLLDSKGHPDKAISDHLPLIFEIKEK